MSIVPIVGIGNDSTRILEKCDYQILAPIHRSQRTNAWTFAYQVIGIGNGETVHYYAYALL